LNNDFVIYPVDPTDAQNQDAGRALLDLLAGGGEAPARPTSYTSLADVPADTTGLRIMRIRKPDLKRLDGLDRFPLKHLELRWLSAPDLQIVPLPKTLISLKIWHSRSLRSCSGIEQAKKLRRLEWRQNSKLEDGFALAQLPDLRSLSIEGGPDGGQKLGKLDFLIDLSLDELVLNGIDGKGVDLSPVAHMRQPKELLLNGRNFPKEEVAKVAAANKAYYDDLLRLDDIGGNCDSCAGPVKGLRLQGHKFCWCPTCEKDALDRVFGKFDTLVSAVAT